MRFYLEYLIDVLQKLAFFLMQKLGDPKWSSCPPQDLAQMATLAHTLIENLSFLRAQKCLNLNFF